uniref:Uncharacterized protein n=1 Tax=Oryza glumipatula TaxID=40148 RepID=A0A0D9Y8E5_9ORYZ
MRLVAAPGGGVMVAHGGGGGGGERRAAAGLVANGGEAVALTANLCLGDIISFLVKEMGACWP